MRNTDKTTETRESTTITRRSVLAAYLLAAHHEYARSRRGMKLELADRMGVTYGTFQEYVARARREAMEYRVGGSVNPRRV